MKHKVKKAIIEVSIVLLSIVVLIVALNMMISSVFDAVKSVDIKGAVIDAGKEVKGVYLEIKDSK